MRTHSFFTKLVTLSVCFGVMLSGPAFAGASSVIKDIALSDSGTLFGQVTNSAGQPMSDTLVRLRYQGKAVAVARSNNKGQFAINGVRPGAHDLSTGGLNTPVRVWKQGTAPKGALKGILIAGEETVIRGQDMYVEDEYCETCPPGVGASGFGLLDVITLATVGAAVGGLVVGINNSNKIDDLEDAINNGNLGGNNASP